MKFVLIGIQGSGKGTQARLLRDKYGFDVFETGHVLRDLAEKQTPLGRKIKSCIDVGEHISSNIINDILKDYLSSTTNENIIFDGLVRNMGNKKIVDEDIKDYRVLFFDMSEKEAMKRILGRVYNSRTGESFPAGTLKDPNTGEDLEKRNDDQEQAIKKRIERFYENTLPLIDIYEQECRLIRINAEQGIDEVFSEIEKKLGL